MGGYPLSLIFLPALDLYVVKTYLAERFYERTGKARVGYKRDVMVNGGTPYAVAIAQFTV